MAIRSTSHMKPPRIIYNKLDVGSSNKYVLTEVKEKFKKTNCACIRRKRPGLTIIHVQESWGWAL